MCDGLASVLKLKLKLKLNKERFVDGVAFDKTKR